MFTFDESKNENFTLGSINESGAFERTEYDSVCAMVDRIGDKLPQDALNDTAFIGRKFTTIQSIIDAANSVWKQGFKVFEELRSDIAADELPQPKARRRKRRRNDEGRGEFDADAYLSGAEAFFVETVKQARTAPQLLTIVVEVNGTGNKSSLSLAWRGVAALILTDLLEAAGYRVRIVAMGAAAHAYEDGAGQVSTVVVKAHSAPLDSAALVSVLSGWFYRTYWFGNRALSNTGRNVRRTMGRSLYLDAERCEAITGVRSDIYIANIFDRYACKDFIVETIRKVESGELIAAA